METFSALLAIYAGNSSVTGDFPAQWPVTRALVFSLICGWIYCWVNKAEAGDLRRHRAHPDVILMKSRRVWVKSTGTIIQLGPLSLADNWSVVRINNYICCFTWDVITHPWPTIYPKKYAHGFVVLCFVVVMQSFIMNSHEVFIHIHQGCFAGTGAIVRLPQCQWIKPAGYGKISQCITTTKHSKAKTVCIFLGIYCNFNFG